MKMVFVKDKKIELGFLTMLILFLVGCRQSILNEEVQLENIWGNIFILEEKTFEDDNFLVCAFEDSIKRVGIAIFEKNQEKQYVLKSSIVLPEGSIVVENIRSRDTNYIVYYARHPDKAYLEILTDDGIQKYDINGLTILKKVINQEIKVKYYE